MMRKFAFPSLIAVALAMGGVNAPVLAQERGDQGQARKEMKAGNVQSLRDIERRILPQMKSSEYLGPEYDADAMAYRLKFIREGRVMFVDIDARSGKVLRRSN